jgi:ubiquinone/menaquinone biosynthesis C-methylase UbiE
MKTFTAGASMASRGESDFARFPGVAAWLYDWLLRIRPVERQTGEIARELASRLKAGRVLEIGTGPGRLLFELHKLNDNFEIFGLDISVSMLRRARKNLQGVSVDLRQGSIRHTEYDSGFFDAITCVGSFYLWDQPAECVDEIFRILKAGHSAYLFESYRDCDEQEFRHALAANLATVDPLRRLISRLALKKQLRMTYRTDEFERILGRTRFANSYALTKVNLAGMPVWLQIRLSKAAEAGLGAIGSK